MTIKLSIEERLALMKYVHRLPCSLALRIDVEPFFQQLELTQDEQVKYDVKMDTKTFIISTNDSEYKVEYENFPPTVISAIKDYISLYDTPEFSTNFVIQSTLTIFKKVV